MKQKVVGLFLGCVVVCFSIQAQDQGAVCLPCAKEIIDSAAAAGGAAACLGDTSALLGAAGLIDAAAADRASSIAKQFIKDINELLDSWNASLDIDQVRQLNSTPDRRDLEADLWQAVEAGYIVTFSRHQGGWDVLVRAAAPGRHEKGEPTGATRLEAIENALASRDQWPPTRDWSGQ